MADKAQQTKTQVKPLIRTEAKVAGGALVVSVSGGDAPKVWRSDLSRLSAAAFELKDEGANGSVGAAVVLKTPAGAETVHVYPGRAEAVAGLQAITQALFTQQGMTPAAPVRASGGLWGKFFKTIFYILAVMVCVVVLFVIMMPKVSGPGMTPVPPRTGAAPEGGGKTGVPLPADKLFGK
jgi:hypothetical protein